MPNYVKCWKCEKLSTGDYFGGYSFTSIVITTFQPEEHWLDSPVLGKLPIMASLKSEFSQNCSHVPLDGLSDSFIMFEDLCMFHLVWHTLKGHWSVPNYLMMYE